jgi:hypothetical protein
VATWSPGDGVTRYRFFRLEDVAKGGAADYFSVSGGYTARGFKDALAFAEGLRAGARAALASSTNGFSVVTVKV